VIPKAGKKETKPRRERAEDEDTSSLLVETSRRRVEDHSACPKGERERVQRDPKSTEATKIKVETKEIEIVRREGLGDKKKEFHLKQLPRSKAKEDSTKKMRREECRPLLRIKGGRGNVAINHSGGGVRQNKRERCQGLGAKEGKSPERGKETNIRRGRKKEKKTPRLITRENEEEGCKGASANLLKNRKNSA